MKLASALYDGHYPFNQWKMFTDFTTVVNPDELTGVDALVVWGGEDISPSLYNQSVRRETGAGPVPSRRDTLEWNLMKSAVERGIPIIGVCRGAQMLCALAGGTLYQHVNNHAGSSHDAECDDGSIIKVSSLHHQMMNPTNTEHELVAWSTEVRSNVHLDDTGDVPTLIEPEYIYFPKVKGHAIQWHPEFQGLDAGANVWLRDRWINKGL